MDKHSSKDNGRSLSRKRRESVSASRATTVVKESATGSKTEKRTQSPRVASRDAVATTKCDDSKNKKKVQKKVVDHGSKSELTRISQMFLNDFSGYNKFINANLNGKSDFTFLFVTLAIDTGLPIQATCGPSLGILMAVADVFGSTIGTGAWTKNLAYWESMFQNDSNYLSNPVVRKIMKVYEEKYDLRISTPGPTVIVNVKKERRKFAEKPISSDTDGNRSIRERLQHIARPIAGKSGKPNIFCHMFARFLVKLWEAKNVGRSLKERETSLGKVICSFAKRSAKSSDMGALKYANIWKRSIIIPKELKHLYAKENKRVDNPDPNTKIACTRGLNKNKEEDRKVAQPKSTQDTKPGKRKVDLVQLKEALNIQIRNYEELEKEYEGEQNVTEKEKLEIKKWREFADHIKTMNETIGLERLEGVLTHLKKLTLECENEKRKMCLRDIILNATDGEMTGTIILEITKEDAKQFKRKMAKMSTSEPVASSSRISICSLDDSSNKQNDTNDGEPSVAEMSDDDDDDDTDDFDSDDVEHTTENGKRKSIKQLEGPDAKSLKLADHDFIKTILNIEFSKQKSHNNATSLDTSNVADITNNAMITLEEMMLECSPENNIDVFPTLVVFPTDAVESSEMTEPRRNNAETFVENSDESKIDITFSKKEDGVKPSVEEKNNEVESAGKVKELNEEVEISDNCNEGENKNQVEFFDKGEMEINNKGETLDGDDEDENDEVRCLDKPVENNDEASRLFGNDDEKRIDEVDLSDTSNEKKSETESEMYNELKDKVVECADNPMKNNEAAESEDKTMDTNDEIEKVSSKPIEMNDKNEIIAAKTMEKNDTIEIIAAKPMEESDKIEIVVAKANEKNDAFEHADKLADEMNNEAENSDKIKSKNVVESESEKNERKEKDCDVVDGEEKNKDNETNGNANIGTNCQNGGSSENVVQNISEQ